MAEGAWVLVADSSRARIFQDDGAGLEEIMDFTEPMAHLHTRDIVSHQWGRRGTATHIAGSIPNADPKEIAAQRFAKRLAEVLNRGALEGMYERLIIAAPPHFLGLLRKALSPSSEHCLTLAIPHDFTAFRADEISERIHVLKRR